MTPKVTISLVTWNGAKFIKTCLNSLNQQSFRDFETIVIDNASPDNTRELIKGATRSKDHPVQLVANRQNLGFAKAQNQAIKLARGEYILVLNQDVELQNDFLEKLVAVIDQHGDVAAAGGKIMRAGDHRLIDSTGLVLKASRQVVDRGADTTDNGQYNRSEHVFGISGAVALYRKAALEQIRLGDEYFDEDFFSYKEDIDLAFRLNLAGWKAYYQPQAVAFHHRGSGATSQGLFRQIQAWRQKSDFLVYHSYKNHIFTLIKNERAGNLVANLLSVVGHEFKKFLALLLFKPHLLTVSVEIINKLPGMLDKRRQIQNKVKWTYPLSS